MTIFRKETDHQCLNRFSVFLRNCAVDLIAYHWMPCHWHMIHLASKRQRESRLTY